MESRTGQGHRSKKACLFVGGLPLKFSLVLHLFDALCSLPVILLEITVSDALSLCRFVCILEGHKSSWYRGPAWARNVKRGGRFGRGTSTSHSQAVGHSQVSVSSSNAWSDFSDDTSYGMLTFGGASSMGKD